MLRPLAFTLAVLLAMACPAASATPAAVPFRLINNHVYVDALLNGRGPFHFIVDSGAGNVIDPAVARAIGVPVRGRVQLIGVGYATEQAGTAVVREVRIGDATFADQRFVVTPARSAFGAAEGPIVDGLIGRDIIGAAVTVFDYSAHVLTFDAPPTEVARDGATILPVTVRDGLPHVPCALAGIAGACTVDTGSRLSATILEPFVRAHPDVVPTVLSATGVDGYGLGGAAYGRLGRLATLTFGELIVPDVVADYSTQTRGVFADSGTAANIGGGVWQRFTLTFDLPHARISLRPNDAFAQPESVDRSGLFLVVRNGSITVYDVRPQTPAARSGIAANDTIVAADGRHYAPTELPDLRALLRGPTGTIVRLTLLRGIGEPREIPLLLGDYL